MRWQKHFWLFRNKKTSPSHPLWGKGERGGEGEKKAFEWLLIQFSIASLISSPGNTSVSMVKTDVTSHCSAGTAELQTQNQSPVEGVGVGRADSQHSTNCSTRTTLPPAHTSSRAHSPLPILISLPLAKESPQFPLPPRAAAFIFFQVVNYNSRAKSTVNFYSLPNNLIFCKFLFLLSSSPRITAFTFLLRVFTPVFQFFSKHVAFTHNVRRLPHHAFFKEKKKFKFLFF